MNVTVKRWRATALHSSVIVLLSVAAVCWADQGADDDPVVAVVNGHDIKLSYVYAQIENMPLGDQIAVREKLDRFIESIIREEVLFQSMLASDFGSEPALREEIKAMVVERLIDRHVTQRIDVSDERVEDYYRQNASAIRGEHVRASAIRLARTEECRELMGAIDSPEAFEAAARERSLDERSAARGGDIGLFMNHEGPYGFEVALFDMQPDEMRVFESSDGCHLVRITERVTPPLPPLEEVEPRIRTLLRTQQERALLHQLLERAESDLSVVRNPLQ